MIEKLIGILIIGIFTILVIVALFGDSIEARAEARAERKKMEKTSDKERMITVNCPCCGKLHEENARQYRNNTYLPEKGLCYNCFVMKRQAEFPSMLD